MRRPNTDSTPHKPVTLPPNQIWYVTRPRVPSTLSRYGVTIHGNVTSVYPTLVRHVISYLEVLRQNIMGMLSFQILVAFYTHITVSYSIIT